MDSVISELSFILKPKARAAIPESNYYLGKALAAKGKGKDADRALTAFVQARKESPNDPFLVDAYYTLSLSREASGNRRGAIDACRAGLTIESKEKRDQFLYKLGELLLQDRQPREARVQWAKLAKEGVDPEWRKMATQAVASLDLQKEMSEVKSLVSK
jgi:TolA-binding protein